MPGVILEVPEGSFRPLMSGRRIETSERLNEQFYFRVSARS